jgi:hypothetical protein
VTGVFCTVGQFVGVTETFGVERVIPGNGWRKEDISIFFFSFFFISTVIFFLIFKLFILKKDEHS